MLTLKDPSEKAFDNSSRQPKLSTAAVGETDYYGVIPMHHHQQKQQQQQASSFSSLPTYVASGDTVYGVPQVPPPTEKQTDAAISLLRKNLMEEHEKVLRTLPKYLHD